MTNQNTNNSIHKNPFFFPYNTPHNTAPFDRIQLNDYESAITKGIEDEDKEIQEICDNPVPPTFENTIIPFCKPDGLLDRATTVFFNLLSANTCDEMDALAQKLSPVLSEHSNNIMLNERLFARIKSVYVAHTTLKAEEQTLLDKIYDSFVRSGANLDEEGKKKFREITAELSKLTLQFSQNELHDTNDFFLNIIDEQQLSGLPNSAIEAAALCAKERQQTGWTFTLKAPSFSPFMTYADNRDLRKKMFLAGCSICTHDDKFSNLPIVKKLVNLRHDLANLLGYRSYADYVLEKRMAKDVTHVNKLLQDLLQAYKPIATEEYKAIENKAKSIEGNSFELEPWDTAYYSHKLLLERFNIDAEMLRPYFQLSNVIKGIFGLANKLYGITFKENKNIPVFHLDVTAYEVFDKDGTFLAVFYADFFPRDGKQSGAWMTNYKGQWYEGEDNSRPHVSVTMNLTKPTEDKPALLTLGEVETFLHEFGHALHGMFADTRFESLSGTNVYWDFVELPSQFMENYSVEKEFLHTFAFHYKTGEPIPDELIDRIVQSRNFNVASACIRQVSFGLLDMAYYTRTSLLDEEIKSFERKAMQPALLRNFPKEFCMSTRFSHIMSGGYAAGYYSYKWAEVLDADAFSLFKEKGIFNQKVAQSFRQNILSKGATEPPMTLYIRFRGKEPTINALLERNGLPIKK